MHAPRMVAAVVLATMVGCSSSTPTSSTRSSTTTPKTTTTVSKPPLVQASASAPAASVTTAPLRDGHALAIAKTEPATITATNAGGTVSYQPDPPDVQVSLQVPDTSLGARVSAYQVSYSAQGQASPPPPQSFPVAPKTVYPGDLVPIQVGIGSSVLKPLITGSNPAPVITATVRFMGDDGQPIQGTDGQDLTATVAITVQ